MFNAMTLAAACELIVETFSHNDLDLLFVSWEVDRLADGGSKSGRAASLAKVARDGENMVYTERGLIPLSRAIVEKAAVQTYTGKLEGVSRKFVAGLRFDGFEIIEVEKELDTSLSTWRGQSESERELRKMYPADIPGLDFREAENEIMSLLNRSGFTQTSGHLGQAIRIYSSGDWAGANGQLRTFLESLLQEIAIRLGFQGRREDAAEVRGFLGEKTPPMLLETYNEWNSNTNKPQYFQGLWQRMHAHGSHPGMSEEEDCTFRLHIMLITARLLLRRFAKRP